jgi:hypothetical protein
MASVHKIMQLEVIFDGIIVDQGFLPMNGSVGNIFKRGSCCRGSDARKLKKAGTCGRTGSFNSVVNNKVQWPQSDGAIVVIS